MRFELTYDYLCPFARNTNEAVLNGLTEGRDWDVRLRPFSLSQAHVSDGEDDVYEDVTCPGILAHHWGIAVRDHDPARFADAHRALFSARHDRQLDLSDPGVIRDALDEVGVDVATAEAVVRSGSPAAILAAEHTEAVSRWRVFGVPTFIMDDVATFVRCMERGRIEDVDRVIDLLEWQGLNEFKRTLVPR